MSARVTIAEAATAKAVRGALATRPLHAVDGLLLVDKPAGVTSHDVVARVRRALRTKRVGHAGTLDPFATGLVVCAIGRATRLLQFVHGEPKVYQTRIAFGVGTDTDDSTGTPNAHGPAPRWERLQEALAALTGDVLQLPPAYSAKHVDGERAYAKARRGEEVALKAVMVRVSSWEVSARGDLWLDATIACGGGTYIRALARDLGTALGTVAHCESLRRVSSGALHVDNAVTFDALVPDASIALINPLVAMTALQTVVVDDVAIAALRMGKQIDAFGEGAQAVFTDAQGEVIGVGERVGVPAQPPLEPPDAQRPGMGNGRWQPRVILPAEVAK